MVYMVTRHLLCFRAKFKFIFADWAVRDGIKKPLIYHNSRQCINGRTRCRRWTLADIHTEPLNQFSQACSYWHVRQLCLPKDYTNPSVLEFTKKYQLPLLFQMKKMNSVFSSQNYLEFSVCVLTSPMNGFWISSEFCKYARELSPRWYCVESAKWKYIWGKTGEMRLGLCSDDASQLRAFCLNFHGMTCKMNS